MKGTQATAQGMPPCLVRGIKSPCGSLLIVFACSVAGLSVRASQAVLKSDPAKNLARVRLIVTGTAATTDITVSGATLASYTSIVLDGPDGSAASQTGGTMRMSNAGPGRTAEARFDMILADVVPGRTITWNLTTNVAADTGIEVFALNDLENPRRVDRFTAQDLVEHFTTPSSLLTPDTAFNVGLVLPHLVLAQFYPWYTTETWQDPQLADQPMQPFSADNQADLDRQAAEAASAGIDAFVVSWQGPAAEWNGRRMRMILRAAKQAGMRAAFVIESPDVNPADDPKQPTDPGSMVTWLEDAVDQYGSDPAYLRVDGRPVVLANGAWFLTEAQWRSVLATVRATGRNPIVIGDFFHSRLINVLDGEYQYSNVTQSATALMETYRTETLRVRTFNLLKSGDPRRVWVASVSPGYDDRRIVDRATHVFVDRANGSLYDDQWRTAVTMAADWVVIATWNEFFENTEIEPSARYGSFYLDATRKWSAAFKGKPR